MRGVTQLAPPVLTLQRQDERSEVRCLPVILLSQVSEEGALPAAVIPQDLVRPLTHPGQEERPGQKGPAGQKESRTEKKAGKTVCQKIPRVKF